MESYWSEALLVIIIARELGPLVTAIIVISRSGSAIAAEISTQQMNREILSLELMGIDTKLYIISSPFANKKP